MPELVIRRDYDDDDRHHQEASGTHETADAEPVTESRHARADSTSDDEAPSNQQRKDFQPAEDNIIESPSGYSWNSREVEQTSHPSTKMEVPIYVRDSKGHRRPGERDEEYKTRMQLLSGPRQPSPPLPRRSRSLDRYREVEIRRRETTPPKRRSVYIDEPRRSRRSGDYFEDDYYDDIRERDTRRRLSNERARERRRHTRDYSYSPSPSPSPRHRHTEPVSYIGRPMIQHYATPHNPYTQTGHYGGYHPPHSSAPVTYIQPPHPQSLPVPYSVPPQAPPSGVPPTYHDAPPAPPIWDRQLAVGMPSGDKVAEMMEKYAEQVKEKMRAEQDAERLRRKELEAEERLRKAEAREKMLHEQDAMRKDQDEKRRAERMAERMAESEKQRYESEAKAKKGYEEALEKLESRIRIMQEAHAKYQADMLKDLSEQNERLAKELHEVKDRIGHFEAQAKQRAKSESEDIHSVMLDGSAPYVDDFLHYQADMQAQAHGITAFERKAARNGGKKTHAKGAPLR